MWPAGVRRECLVTAHSGVGHRYICGNHLSLSLSPFIGWTRPPISDGGLVTLLNLLYNCGLEHSFSLESNCST